MFLPAHRTQTACPPYWKQAEVGQWIHVEATDKNLTAYSPPPPLIYLVACVFVSGSFIFCLFIFPSNH